MPADIDERWEYWVPDPEVALALAEANMPDGTLVGYLGHWGEAGFRVACGGHALRSLPFRERGRRREAGGRPTWVVRCGVCGREYETGLVERDGCGSACRNKADLVARVLAMRRAGVTSLAEIAAAVGVKVWTANRWLKRAGLTRPKAKPKRKEKAHDGHRRQTGAHPPAG